MNALIGLAFAIQVQSGLPTWTLSPTPTLTIEDDGTPAKQFEVVTGVVRLASGHIAVANRGSNDVRIFDAGGRHVGTFGQTGAGPGEFRRIELVGRSGDTAWFYDSNLRRVTSLLLSAKPELLGTTLITATGKRESFSEATPMTGGAAAPPARRTEMDAHLQEVGTRSDVAHFEPFVLPVQGTARGRCRNTRRGGRARL